MRSILQKSNAALSAAALTVLLVAGSPAVAFAEGGISGGSTSGSGSGSTSGSTSTSSGTTTSSTTTSGSTATTTKTESETPHVEGEATTATTAEAETSDNNHESRHNKAEKMLKEHKAEHKPEKTDAEKAKACDEHKNGLETKFTSIARNSAAYQSRIDAILAQAIAYQKDNNVVAPNFAALVTAADAAQATAKISVAALQTASTTPINCADKTVANNVAEFKVTAANARRDLKAYKVSVKAVLKSLRDAKADETTTTTTEAPKTTEKSN